MSNIMLARLSRNDRHEYEKRFHLLTCACSLRRSSVVPTGVAAARAVATWSEHDHARSERGTRPA